MSLPYFPMYPKDFEADTSHLSLEEDGAYNRLLRLCWMTPDCSLPDDDAWIMRRMRVDADTYERVVRVILNEFFRRKSGRVSNARLATEYGKSNQAHSRRVLAGKSGGTAKALKTKETVPSNATAMPYQPEPEPEPYKKEEGKPSSKKNPRRCRLPDGWIPNERNIADAISKQFSEREIENEGRKFYDHHRAKGSTMLDWDAAWRTWIGNARQWAKPPNRSAGGGTVTAFAAVAARNRSHPQYG